MIRQLKIQYKTGIRLQWSLFTAVLCILFSQSVFALGLGGIKLHSNLNQNLNADIELLSVGDLELSDITIKLASPAVYDRMGIERSSLFDKLKFEVNKTDAGEYFIHVSTPLSINEPFLNFLVEVNWSSGRLIREFTVLLDPPVFLKNEGNATISAPEVVTPSPDVAVTEIEESNSAATEQTDPVEPEPIKVEEPIIEEQVAANESGVSEEISNILAGEDRAAEIITDVPEPAIDLTEVKASSSLVYQKVKQDEFLWKIANKMRPEDVTVEQMMVALLRQNPNAFFGDNISMLKAGAVLRIDDTASLSDLSANQALMEVAQQNKDWLSYRKERQAQNAVAAESANLTPMGGEVAGNNATSSSAASVDVSTRPLLELVAAIKNPKSKSQSSNAALEASEEKINELNIELVMATEEMEARKRENEDLVTRLNSLEEQMSAMQSLVQLKDAELAKIRTDETAPEGEALLEVGESDDVISESSVTKVVSKELDEESHDQPLWQDPVTLATIIAAILLIALGGVLLRRRSNEGRMTAEELEDSEKTLDELLNMDSYGDTRVTSVIGDDSFIQDEPQPDLSGIDEVDIPNSDLDPMTEVASEDTVFMNSGMDVLDPLSEADVYITYERFDKAEELLRGAIQETPNRQELKLKLLEVYAASSNTDMFNNQADELYAAIDGDEFNPIWQQATAIANVIGSTNPLFSTEAEITPTRTLNEYDESIFDEDEDFDEKTQISNVQHIGSRSQSSKSIPAEDWEPQRNHELPEREPDNDILDTQIEAKYANDGDLFDSSTVEKVSAPSENLEQYRKEALIAGVETIHADLDVDDLQISSHSVSPRNRSDFDRKNEGRTNSKIELSDEDLSNAMTSFSKDSNVESLIQDNEKENRSSVIVSDAFNDSTETREPVSIADSRRQGGENAFFLLSDEVGTKLDLARAYIEMGDYDGASDLLEEVMAEGNNQQKRQAKKLMRKTGT